MKNTYSFLFSTLFATLLCFTACKSDNPDTVDCDNLLPAELCPDVAKTLVDAFALLQTNEPDKDFVKGFEASFGDVEELLSVYDTTSDDTHYALFAYKAEVDSFDLILCIESPSGSGEYRYFDFMRPCPKFCPDTTNYGNAPLEKLGKVNDHLGYYFDTDEITRIITFDGSGPNKPYFMLFNKESAWNDSLNVVIEAPIGFWTVEEMFPYCGDGVPCHVID